MVAAASSPPTLTPENITAATGNVFAVVGDTLGEIVSQPIFLMFLVSGLIFMSIRMIRSLKRT